MRSLARRRSDDLPLSDLGPRAEKFARKHLKRNGYRIVETNYNTRFGEIDIVAGHGPCLVFVEVKARAGDDAVAPELAVDHRKMKKLRRTARAYIAERDLDAPAMRFDIVAVTVDRKGSRMFAEIIENAFPAD